MAYLGHSKIGDVVFTATTDENVTYENEVTDRPVEDLGYISDHVKQRPVRFEIEGIVVGDDSYPKLKLLRQYSQGKEVYTYHGRNIMSDVVIENFNTNHGKDIRNGFAFSMGLKIVKRSISKKVPVPGSDPVKKDMVKTEKTTEKGGVSGGSAKEKAYISSQTKEMKSKGKVLSYVNKTDKQQATKFMSVKTKAFLENATRKGPTRAKAKSLPRNINNKIGGYVP